MSGLFYTFVGEKFHSVEVQRKEWEKWTKKVNTISSFIGCRVGISSAAVTFSPIAVSIGRRGKVILCYWIDTVTGYRIMFPPMHRRHSKRDV